VLGGQVYEEIIGITQGMGRALERSPSTFAKLQEEELRDFLLVLLNGSGRLPLCSRQLCVTRHK
jgi:hypothetical protein